MYDIVGAAATFVNVYLGTAVLALGGPWYGRSCYKDYRRRRGFVLALECGAPF